MRKIPLLFAIVPLLAAHATEPVALTETTVIAEKPAGLFTDFGAYAPLAEALAKDPEREREWEFFKAAKNRLQNKVDRSDSSDVLIARFRKEFGEEKVHYATAIAVATLVGNQGYLLKKEDGDLASALLRAINDAPPQAAVLYLKARTNISKQRSTGPGAENLFRLKDWIIKTPEFTGFPDKIRNTPQETVLYSIFTDSPQHRHLADKEFEENIKFFEVLKKIPDDQKTAAMHIALGTHITRLAWRIRSGEFGHKVASERMDQFKKLLPSAGEHFRAAIKIDPTNFDAYAGLLTIAMASDEAADGSVDYWYEEAKANVTNPDELLLQYAHASQLRWSGRPESIIEAYYTALKNGDYDSARPWMASNIMEKLIHDVDSDREVMLRRAVAKDFINIANDYTRRLDETGKPLIGSDGSPLNIRAKAVAKLVDGDLIGSIPELIPALTTGYDSAGINEVSRHINARNQVHYAMKVASYETGDGALYSKWDLTAKNLAMKKRPDDVMIRDQPTVPELKEARAALEASLKKTKSEVAREFVESQLGILACKQDFLEGKTAKIPMKRNQWSDAFLTMKFGDEKISADRYTWTSINHVATYLDYFEPPYEVTLNVESDWYDKWPHPGVLIGRNLTAGRGTGVGRSFVIEPDTGTMRVIPSHSGLEKTTLTMKDKSYVGKDTCIRVRVFDHGYSVSVNGGPFESKHDPEFQPLAISVGCLLGYMANGKFTFHDMSIRKIPETEITEKEAGFGRRPDAPNTPAPAAVASVY